MSNDTCAKPLKPHDLIGLTITTEAGLVSAAAILVLIGLIVRQVIRNTTGGGPRQLLKTHLDIYMVSLLVSDLLQAIGAIMDLHWIRQGSVTCGAYCTTQGAIQTLGEPSVAMATMVIAIHTFCVIFFRWAPPRSFLIPLLVVGAIWLYVFLYVGISVAKHHSSNSEYFVPTPYWCWISPQYGKDRVSQEYFWLWFAALFSIVLYVPLFFVIRGNIVVYPGKRGSWHISFCRKHHVERMGYPFSPSRQSLKMLLYPGTYILIVLPVTVTRWIDFSNGENDIPSFWTFFGVAIFGLSGMANVLLLTLTRPSILSFGTSSGGPGSAPARTTNGATSMLHFPFDQQQMRRSQDLPRHGLSVQVRVEQGVHEEDLERDNSSMKSPSITAPDTSGADAPSVRIAPLRAPSPAYQLQDMRDKVPKL